MQENKVDRLRADILASGATYAEIGRESGLTGNYIRKFAVGEFEPTVTKFDVLRTAVTKLKRRNGS